MWPRHNADFSMFRIYAGADNKPADERMDALRALFAQYQDVQNRFIESFSEHYEHEAADARQRAERERDAELLAQLRGDWRRDGQVELFNYFRELQVPTTVPLDEIDGPSHGWAW